MADRVLPDPSTLPTAPVSGGEPLRRKMAEEGRRDLYFLSKVILGYQDMTSHTHGALCKFLDSAMYQRRMVLMPRLCFKTTLATISHSIQLIINDPNISILLISDTETNAANFLEEIKQHFRYNELFRWCYPELVPENFNTAKWSSTSIIIPRDIISRAPTVNAIGAFGGVESRHFRYIKADDLATEKSIHSDTEMDKLVDWAGGLESLLVDINEDHIDFIGSRRKKGDIYEAMEKFYGRNSDVRPIGPHAELKGEIAVFSRGAIENGESIFPERMSMGYLTRMRESYPERFWSQLANSPKGTGLNTFNIEWLRRYTQTTDGKILAKHNGHVEELVDPWRMDRIIVYDPSVAEKKINSQQAIHVLGKGKSQNRYVLESIVGHYPPDEAVDILFELNKKWRPILVSIEKRGFQGWVKYWLDERAEMLGLPYLPVVPWPPEGSHKAEWSKTEHIRALQPMMRSGLLWVLDEHHELIEQVEFHPNVRHDDALDALVQALDIWPYMSDESEEKEKITQEEQFLAAHGMHDPRFDPHTGEREKWDEEAFLASFDATGYGRVQA